MTHTYYNIKINAVFCGRNTARNSVFNSTPFSAAYMGAILRKPYKLVIYKPKFNIIGADQCVRPFFIQKSVECKFKRRKIRK